MRRTIIIISLIVLCLACWLPASLWASRHNTKVLILRNDPGSVAMQMRHDIEMFCYGLPVVAFALFAIWRIPRYKPHRWARWYKWPLIGAGTISGFVVLVPAAIAVCFWHQINAPLDMGGVLDPMPPKLHDLLTGHPMKVIFATGFICIVWVAWWEISNKERLRNQADGVACPECGYNVSGCTGNRCSECGARLDSPAL